MSKKILSILSLLFLITVFLGTPINADAVKSARKPPQKRYTFEEVDAKYVVAAKVNLMGLGDGYHAKLVFAAPKSAFSFGIQYDNGAAAPYTGRVMLLTENVFSNDPGGQEYDRPRNIELKTATNYDLMMSLDRKGKIIIFLNNKPIGTYVNKKLVGKKIRTHVEASGKHNGDIVDVDFTEIRMKEGVIDEIQAFRPYILDNASKIKSRIVNGSHVYIHGKLSDIPEGADWGSDYDSVSGIVEFRLDN